MLYIYLHIYTLMFYQLPNGKVVNMSIEEYLDLTDEDVQYLMSLDFGEHIVDPFQGSAVKKNTKEKFYDFGTSSDEDKDDNISSKDIDFPNNLDT